MSSELAIIALYGLLIVVTIMAQVTLALPQFGLGYLLSSRDERRKLAGVAARLERAVSNSVIGMALFAPAVLILHTTAGLTASTLLAAQIFLLARVLYVLLYAAGVPWLRTLSWLVAVLATAFLYLLAL